MAPRSSSRPLAAIIVGIALLAGLAVACGPGGAPSAPPTPAATLGATAEPSRIAPSPSVAVQHAPPDAVLAAEGGDPVTGQLGTYLWLDTGSDSPWLPGAPLVVGTGEPLTLTLVPDTDIETWLARFVPADAQGPDGAITLGRGTASGSFPAPEPGIWTVEVSVQFAEGAGQASYFWRLQVE